MSASKSMRQVHRWLSVIFTLAVIANVATIATGGYVDWVGCLAVVPLLALLPTGLYLFFMPYVAKWRRDGRAGVMR